MASVCNWTWRIQPVPELFFFQKIDPLFSLYSHRPRGARLSASLQSLSDQHVDISSRHNYTLWLHDELHPLWNLCWINKPPWCTAHAHGPEVFCYNSFAVPGTRCLCSVWLKDFSHSILPCSYLFKSVPWTCSCTYSFLQTCGFPPEHPVAGGCERKPIVHTENLFFPTSQND